MQFMQWFRVWIASIWKSNANDSLDISKHEALMVNANQSHPLHPIDCSWCTQMTTFQQEQIQLSKDMVGILHLLLAEAKALTAELSKRDDSCPSETVDITKSSDSLVDPSTTSSPSSTSSTCFNCQRKSKIRPMDTSTVDEIELYTPGGNYHLISNTYKIILPERPWKKKCKLAILISSGPYSGSDVIMNIVASWLEEIQVSFRGMAFWGFHAHTNMNMDQAPSWLNEFHTWLHSLGRGDIVILRTPYYQEDGNAARQVCQESYIIHSGLSLEETALLHRFQNSSADESFSLSSPMNEKKTLEYLRHMVLHQKRWKEDANLTIHMSDFGDIQKVALYICQELIQNYLGFHKACQNPVLWDPLKMEKKEVIHASYHKFLQQEERLTWIRSHHVDDATNSLLTQVQSTFHHWIVSDSKQN